MKAWIASLTLGLALVLPALPLSAAEPGATPKATSLDELLEQVRSGWRMEKAEDRKREARFTKQRNEQKRLLARAKATRSALEKRSDELEHEFEQNELRIADEEELLRNRLGTLGELFGVVRQVAGDTAGHIEASLVSSQIPGRDVFLGELGQSKALPSIEKLEKLWFALQQEMTESGKVVRFPATVITVAGQEVERDVIRVGSFNAISEGKYLRWLPEVGKLAELGRQPASRYLGTVDDFEASDGGLATLAVDPSRGAILALLVQTPSSRERVGQGGVVGYAIIVLGVAAGLLGLVRLAYILLVSRKVTAQQSRQTASDDNPLGRVLRVYESAPDADPETLELKLDEVILKESAGLDRFLWLIKVVSVIAPLMGLLGTVTGMIQTFQAITLFGTGDPKLMAGGISEALVTTMLGLFVAIPLVLLHSVVYSVSRGVLSVLEEQSAGFVAKRAEQER